MNLTVIGPRVFIRPDQLPDMTSDGKLHLVYDRQKSTMTGTVVAVGDGPEQAKRAVREFAKENDIPSDDYNPEHAVSVGERVLFSPDSGEELIFEKDLLVCMKEDDILAVID